MKKTSSIVVLIGIAVIIAGPCSRADAGENHYSIQIKAVPLVQNKKGFAIYKDLVGKGHLAY